MKIHFCNTRLRVNAGMDFPECYANAQYLDLDKSGLPKTNEREKVTCKRCLASLKRRDIATRKLGYYPFGRKDWGQK